MLFPGLPSPVCSLRPIQHSRRGVLIISEGDVRATGAARAGLTDWGWRRHTRCLQSPAKRWGRRVPSSVVSASVPRFLRLSPPPPPPPPLRSAPSCHLHARGPRDQQLLRPTFSCNQRSVPSPAPYLRPDTSSTLIYTRA